MLDIDSKERLAHMDKEIHTSVLCIFFFGKSGNGTTTFLSKENALTVVYHTMEYYTVVINEPDIQVLMWNLKVIMLSKQASYTTVFILFI